MNVPERRKYYEEELLRSMPLLLSAMDRCPVSVSSGCLDREYWAWATKEFANQDLQRAVLPLAYLYVTEVAGSPYCGAPALLDWICMAVDHWVGMQHAAGGFDHLYIHENSWMAAAFSLVDMLFSYRLLSPHLGETFKARWLGAMKKAGEYLVASDETHGFISNHRLGAAAALLMLANETRESRYGDRAWQLVDEVFSRQSEEGWFLEYEGADPGYETLGLHYLSVVCAEVGEDERILQAALKSLNFVSYFVHPDGSLGGEYGSRACPHFFPGGVEYFAVFDQTASAVAGECVRGLVRGNSCGTRDADIRNLIPLLTSYVRALQVMGASCENSAGIPFRREFDMFWPEAGIFIRSTRETYCIFSGSKGGVVFSFDKASGELSHANCGYAGVLEGGQNISTLFWTSRPAFDCGIAPRQESGPSKSLTVALEAHFYKFKSDRLCRPVPLIFFRIFNNTIGRVAALNRFARKMIIRLFLKKQGKPLGKMVRRMHVSGEAIDLDDVVILNEMKLKSLREYGYLSTIYMASAKYFRNQDMGRCWVGDDLVDKGHMQDTIASVRRIGGGNL